MDTFIKQNLTNLTNLRVVPMGESNFIKPFSILFERDGMTHKWDCIEVHDSVGILLFHTEFRAFVLVRQFRPSLWFHEHKFGENYSEMGVSYELCAGILDKNKSNEQIAIEEVEEELGYRVKSLKKITSSFGALGFGASKQHLYYAQIDESMRISAGGGEGDECIEPYLLPLKKVREFIYDEQKPKGSAMLFAFMWFASEFGIKF